MNNREKVLLGMDKNSDGMYYEGKLGKVVQTKSGNYNIAIHNCRKVQYLSEDNTIKYKTRFEPGLFLIPRKRLIVLNIINSCKENDYIIIKTRPDPLTNKVLVSNVKRLGC
jgi:hypothetical protein